ncbi:MAG: HAD family hydrolase [Actinomycetota bacterium]|nr:HAD family phosphatase [Actinomycetota bacterium]
MADIDLRLVSHNESRIAETRARIVYTDLDGTMLGRGGAFNRTPDGEPTLEPMQSLLAVQSAGIDVVPCSGRAARGLMGDGRILGMPTVIAEMGGIISYEFGTDVVQNYGAYPGDDPMPMRFMESCGAVKLLLDRFEGFLEHHTPWAAHREVTQLFRGRVDTVAANAALEEAGHGWLDLVDNGQLFSRYLNLNAGEAHAYHLVPRGVSKGTAIALDQTRREVQPGECVAIGDAVADLEIAGEVAVLILVRDAVERDTTLAAKALAMDNILITDRPGNLGWADAIALLA